MLLYSLLSSLILAASFFQCKASWLNFSASDLAKSATITASFRLCCMRPRSDARSAFLAWTDSRDLRLPFSLSLSREVRCNSFVSDSIFCAWASVVAKSGMIRDWKSSTALMSISWVNVSHPSEYEEHCTYCSLPTAPWAALAIFWLARLTLEEGVPGPIRSRPSESALTVAVAVSTTSMKMPWWSPRRMGVRQFGHLYCREA